MPPRVQVYEQLFVTAARVEEEGEVGPFFILWLALGAKPIPILLTASGVSLCPGLYVWLEAQMIHQPQGKASHVLI